MPKILFPRKLKTFLIILFSSIAVLVFGYGSITLLLRYISETDVPPSVGEVTDIVLNYISIFVTIVLGIVVYFQAERVNKLEAGQHSIFLGVEKLDYSIPFGTEFLQLNQISDTPTDFHIFQITDHERLGLLGNISLNDGNDRIRLPLVFTTRNAPLITSIQIKHVELNILYHHSSNKPRFTRPYDANIAPIYKFMPDGSQFDFWISISRISKPQIEKITLEILLNVTDQFSKPYIVKTIVEIGQRCEQTYLLSSKSIVTEG